ncbi:MAG: glutaredoxin domain-containing protein [Bacteroidota bacterium]
MKLQVINSFSEFEKYIEEQGNTFLLLYKKGSEQSDCAFDNLKSSDFEGDVLVADVSEVRDIHPKFEIKSAPSFLEFSDKKLVNVYKGCHEKDFFENLLSGLIYKVHNDSDKKPQKRVTVYSTPTCSWCTTLKNYLDSKGILYTDIDVSKDQKVAEELTRRSGQKGVPQTDINGQIIVGFDQKRIDTLLGL